MNSPQKFDQLLIEAIDEGLSTLGEPIKNHLYIILEDDFSITKDAIPQQMEEFSKLLFRIFGLSAYQLEIQLMKKLYAKISSSQQPDPRSIDLSSKEMTLSKYVQKMRESFEITNPSNF